MGQTYLKYPEIILHLHNKTNKPSFRTTQVLIKFAESTDTVFI